MLRYFGIASTVFVISSLGLLAHADGKASPRAEAEPASRADFACASPLAGGQVDEYADRYRKPPVFRHLASPGLAGHIRIFRGWQIDTEACYSGGVHAAPRPVYEFERGVRVFRGGVAEDAYSVYLH